MSASRLSDMSIDDDVIRVSLYRKVIDYLDDTDNTDSIITYETKEDEEYRPDLMAYRIYGSPDLRWVIMLVVGNVDEFSLIEHGCEIEVPPLSVLRTYLREVRDLA